MDTTQIDTTQCTSCKVFRPNDSFIGKKGGIVKQCIKCREKDARQKARPEVKAKRNQRAKEKEYSKTHRAKKRAEDEQSYLAKNAERMREYRKKNKDYFSEYNTTSVNRRLSAIKQQAKKKKYPWELEEDDAKDMMTSECFYCGYLNLDDTVNGIDRMDNTVGYLKTNCVPCCKFCNFIKKTLDAKTFVERCRQISFVHGGPGEYHECWKSSVRVSYSDYKHRAENKALEFMLSEEQFDELCSHNCHYCGRSSSHDHVNGIDRKNNSVGYIIDNCVPCCYQCNFSKTNMTYEVFISKCKAVASREHDIPDMPRCLNVITKRTSTIT